MYIHIYIYIYVCTYNLLYWEWTNLAILEDVTHFRTFWTHFRFVVSMVLAAPERWRFSLESDPPMFSRRPDHGDSNDPRDCGGTRSARGAGSLGKSQEWLGRTWLGNGSSISSHFAWTQHFQEVATWPSPKRAKSTIFSHPIKIRQEFRCFTVW